MRTTALAAALCAAALLFSGCGGDDSDDDSATEPTTGADSTSPPAEESASAEPDWDAEAVIQDYFAAQRAGDAAAICALEDPVYQGFKYGEPGPACLDDLANNTEQFAWAEEIVIVSLAESELGVDAVIQPNAATPDEATITLMPDDEGNLLVTAFG
jgi:hypothetical protein